jgi:hypothetical protein
VQFAIERGLRRLLDLRMHAITYQVAALGLGRSVTAKDPELAQRSGRSAGSRGHPHAKGLGRAIVADLPGSGSIGLRKISWCSARARRSGGGELASQAGSPEPTAQYWIPPNPCWHLSSPAIRSSARATTKFGLGSKAIRPAGVCIAPPDGF